MCTSESLLPSEISKIDVDSLESVIGTVDPGSEEEEDCEGYFLEPSACSINIAERIAEANRELYEDDAAENKSENRARKVQFSDNLVDYEPSVCCSEEELLESAGGSSNSEEELTVQRDHAENDEEKEGRFRKRQNRPKTANKEIKIKQPQDVSQSDNIEERGEEEELEEHRTLHEYKEEEEDAAEQEEEDGNEERGEVESRGSGEADPEQDEQDVLSDEMDEDVVISPFNGSTHSVTENIANEAEENGDSGHSKLLLVLLPREQSSSCESIIGEDILEETGKDNCDKKDGIKEETDSKREKDTVKERKENETSLKEERENKHKSVQRPATESYKQRKKDAQKTKCKLSRISPDLNYSYELEAKRASQQRQKLAKTQSVDEEKARDVKTAHPTDREAKKNRLQIVNQKFEEPEERKSQGMVPRHSSGTRLAVRPKSSYSRKRQQEASQVRPRTAPAPRPCCVTRTNLPRYDGLRSEYGLSAEQLQERRRRTFELKQQQKLEKLTKKQEQVQKRLENEERFSEWLQTKTQRRCGPCRKKGDSLVRSDVYIQTHAVYAAQRGVSYSVDYSTGNRLPRHARHKVVNLEKLFEDVSPHVQRTYRIYLGLEPDK